MTELKHNVDMKNKLKDFTRTFVQNYSKDLGLVFNWFHGAVDFDNLLDCLFLVSEDSLNQVDKNSLREKMTGIVGDKHIIIEYTDFECCTGVKWSCCFSKSDKKYLILIF